ncbi:hypothetical protein TWF481_004240 [Arthrobotrys musiformis]|uniref:F-box domain-containing protein n=1 Tax=Arthrobotrys musiformis TaxID=47236 RepID=A0AAV9WKI1_9PEZI
MSAALVALLAVSQPTIQYLYLQKVSRDPELRSWVRNAFSYFSSLREFSWCGIRETDETGMAHNAVKASAASLQSFVTSLDLGCEWARACDSYTSNFILTGHGIRRYLENESYWSRESYQCFSKSQTIVLPSFVEYQSLGARIFPLPFSQIQRLYLTDVDYEGALDNLLLSFSGLLEINIVYRTKLPSKDSITHHGKTLKLLSLCSGTAPYKRRRRVPTYVPPDVWSTDYLAEIGSKCPKLVELGMCKFHNPQYSTEAMAFPRHHFKNLELLYISLPDLRDRYERIIRSCPRPYKGPYPLTYYSAWIVPGMQEYLNGYGPTGRYAGELVPSKRLKIVAFGVGNIEANASFRSDPLIRKVVYPDSTGEVVRLDPYDMLGVQDDGDLARWKLLRRYPLLIPTEGL